MGRMTREQAVKILKPILDSFVDYANITMKVEDDNTVDALEMAIEALKQPEIIRCKDCEHWKNEHLCESLSRFGSFETKADFYCGYAERKTDE